MRAEDDPLSDDLGAPIAELVNFEVEPSEGLAHRVVGAVRRRHLTSQLATLWWSAIGEAFIEIIQLVAGLTGTRESPKEGTER